MEFSADIKFSSEPMENKEVTITYSGYLFKNNSSSLTIVYGFGDNWMYTNEQKMEKTENGFIANVKMLNFSKFYFCFKNENNFWDNNYNSNFVAPITEFKVDDESFVLNENTAEEIITNLVEYDVSKAQQNVIEQATEDTSFEVYFEQNENIDISDTIVNVTPEEALNENLNKVFSDFYEGTDKIVEEQEEAPKSQIFDINEFSDLFEDFEEESIFDDYYKMSDESTNVQNIVAESSDNTVDNVVTNIIDDLYEGSKAQEHAQEVQPAHILKEKIHNEETALVVSPRALGKFYSFKKKMRIAVYKFFSVLPKILNGNYNEENSK